MAKKSRRVRKKGRSVRLSQAQMVRPDAGKAADVQPTSRAAQHATVARQAAGAQPLSLQEEYSYVISDLERIGLIALAMLVLLIVLALLLT